MTLGAVTAAAARCCSTAAAAAMLSEGAAGRGRCRSAPRRSSRRCSSSCCRSGCRRCTDPLVLWWTEGSAVVEPSCLSRKACRSPSSFAALLDGSWAQHRWRAGCRRVSTRARPCDTARRRDGSRSAFRSAAASDVGRRARSTRTRSSSGRRSGSGRWPTGSAAIATARSPAAWCATRWRTVARPQFEETIEAARQRLQQVNEHLLRTGTRVTLADRSASTVVVLLVRGARCAVLWAGDSRVYRWRRAGWSA